MSKSTFFTGQPIFTQLLNFIPSHLVSSIGARHQANRYCKKFMSYDHLVCMLYSSFHRCSSLRELITGLQANSYRLNHLGLHHTPRRSTLADANKRRPVEFFSDLYGALYERYFGFPDSRRKKDKLYIIDSTTITLFSSVMRGAGSHKADGRKKGGVKAHTMVDAYNNVPCFVHITEGKEHDLTFLPHTHLPNGSTVVFDRAYTKYEQFDAWDKQSVRWVTRIKNDARITHLSTSKVSQSSTDKGVRGDRMIRLGRTSNRHKTKIIEVREVTFEDPCSAKTFRFITNDRESAPEEIAEIYKRRWDIEVLFKRIKQNYPLTYFLGDNPNAIQIQIWCVLICDLLLRIIQSAINDAGQRRWSYANLSSMVKHHLMTYTNIIEFLKDPEKALLQYKPPDHNSQIPLWGASRNHFP